LLRVQCLGIRLKPELVIDDDVLNDSDTIQARGITIQTATTTSTPPQTHLRLPVVVSAAMATAPIPVRTPRRV
jgi:hypothetical protein